MIHSMLFFHALNLSSSYILENPKLWYYIYSITCLRHPKFIYILLLRIFKRKMDLENPEKKTIFTFTLKTSDNNRKTSTTLYYFAQLTLRVVVIALTLSGIYTLVNSSQSVTVFGVVMDAKYTDSSSLR